MGRTAWGRGRIAAGRGPVKQRRPGGFGNPVADQWLPRHQRARLRARARASRWNAAFQRRAAAMTAPASQTPIVFVTGGVVSSLGKGIAAASLAAILEARGLKVTMMKLDPYLNVDPGTMSP